MVTDCTVLWLGSCMVVYDIMLMSFVDQADNIDPHNITIDTAFKGSTDGSSKVRIRWTDPPSPNGLIVLYDIELVKTDVANVSTHY